MSKSLWLLGAVWIACTSQAAGDFIYDAISAGRIGYSGALNRTRIADAVTTLAPGEPWVVDAIGLRVVAVTPGTYQDVTARVRIWGQWSPSNSVFNNLLSDVTWDLGTITNNLSRASHSDQLLDYSSLGSKVYLYDSVTAVDIELLVGGVANNALTMGISSGLAPFFGATLLDGFYRDGFNDGFSSGDFQNMPLNHTNVMFSIYATPLPEGSSLSLLILGGLVALRCRSRRASAA